MIWTLSRDRARRSGALMRGRLHYDAGKAQTTLMLTVDSHPLGAVDKSKTILGAVGLLLLLLLILLLERRLLTHRCHACAACISRRSKPRSSSSSSRRQRSWSTSDGLKVIFFSSSARASVRAHVASFENTTLPITMSDSQPSVKSRFLTVWDSYSQHRMLEINYSYRYNSYNSYILTIQKERKIL